MEPELKQRLIGVTIAVALVVIFVPMLFEKSDDKGKVSSMGIPAIPEEVMEKPLELPKTPEELAPKDVANTGDPTAPQPAAEGEKKTAPPTGFTIVPFNEDPVAAKANAAKQGLAKPGDKTKGKEQAEKPEVKAEPATTSPPKPDKSQLSNPVHIDDPDAEEKVAPVVAPEEPDPVVTKNAKEKQTTTTPSKVETKPKATVAKPGPATAETNAKPTKPAVKNAQSTEAATADNAKATATPKPKVTTPALAAEKPAEAAVKKIEPTKPAVTKPAVTANAPATPSAAKPAPKKPSTFVIQAGSFTDEAAAKQLADKLKQSKFPASIQTIHGDKGSVYKVQVGSEHERAKAEETLKQMETSTGIDGVISERH